MQPSNLVEILLPRSVACCKLEDIVVPYVYTHYKNNTLKYAYFPQAYYTFHTHGTTMLEESQMDNDQGHAVNMPMSSTSLCMYHLAL